MEAQEVLDRVWTHLRAQGSKSLDGLVCAYRGSGGKKCAVGCLISDDEYAPSMEGWSVGSRNVSLPAGLRDHVGLLISLQSIHDLCPVTAWEHKLRLVAASYGLQSLPA